MERPLTKDIKPDLSMLGIQEYERLGGYQALRKALREMTPKQVVDAVSQADLRGRGGAGFVTGMKWSFVPMGPNAPHPKYLIANADEMEPGTFKDRYLLEGNPHQLIEGMLIGAYAVQADVAYVFLRWAYKLAEKRINQAIAEAYSHGYLGKSILGSGWSLEMYLHVSAGRYMCGEETGLLNALEGKRATPRAKPPFPPVSGVWGKPTVVNNVETLSNIRHIISNGPGWFRKLSRSRNGGTKLFGVSGRVKKPGLWELPMGTPIREILEEHAGGMRDGYQFRAVIPGGASTEFLGPEHLDVQMDFEAVQKAGSRMGTGTMVVLDDRTCPVGMVQNLERFFAHESCGWCTPCRDGLPWTARLLQAIEEGQGQPHDLERLALHTKFLGPGMTFCALAPGAMEPLASALKMFREDFERHIREKHCPWRTGSRG
ncbi:MAG TPA: NADH-quinone oxidoreductase subunit NuoF [Terriglobia bacterium]|nr:NADH-quinone oxidoreductase subunit NuoF [Terriglobia bacterium]